MMMRLLLLLIVTTSFTCGFQIQPQSIRSSKTALWQSETNKHDEHEVTRRQAILTSTAAATTTAALVLSTTTTVPAHAAVTTKLNTRTNVEFLEAEYADSVSANGAPEKHLPQVSIEQQASSTTTKTVVAIVPHVMDPEKPHFIEYMWLKDVKSGECLGVKAFQATDPSPPSLTVNNVKEGSTVKALLFCNLHGLWQGEEVVV